MNTKNWVVFTKRTGDPKLRWLQIELARNGIETRRNGESWHAPILEVKRVDLARAKAILAPIDDIPDDDPRWNEPFNVNPSGQAGIGWSL